MNIPTTELTFSEFVECCVRAGYHRYFNEPIPANHPKRELMTNQDVYSLHDAMLQGVRDVSECLKNPKSKRPPSPKQGRGDRERK
jgi:hypothetical protein